MTNTDTKRYDGDSWDLASSVGATATAVAARRALASKGPNPLIDDPFAEPLVNAVGVDAFIRMMNGEVESAEDDPAFTPQRLSEGMAVRTRFFDTFFSRGRRRRCAPSGHPGRPGSTPAHTGCPGRPAPWSTRSISRR